MAGKQTNGTQTAHPAVPAAGEPFDFITFWETYRVKVLTAAAVVVVAFGAIFLWQLFRHRKLVGAEEAFAAASEDDYRAIITNYPDTPTAARALMYAADRAFKTERYDEAMALYEEFQRRFPRHSYVEAVPYNIAACLEAKGQYAQAAERYAEFVKLHPASYLMLHALFSQGRCCEALQSWQKAKDAYERLVFVARDSVFYEEAKARSALMDRKLSREILKAGSGTITPSVAPPAESGTAQPPQP